MYNKLDIGVLIHSSSVESSGSQLGDQGTPTGHKINVRSRSMIYLIDT